MKRPRKQKIEFFRDHLLQWFAINGRYFPWRSQSITDYQGIMSEVLLQRTRAETVAKFYPGFLEKYPDWEALTMASIAELESILRPFGLYKQRAKRVSQLAAEMKRRKWCLPRDHEEVKRIPMFGQYIGNAVMLLVYGEAHPLLDVNMSRVLERFFGPRKMSDIRYDPYLQNLSYKIVDCPEPLKINWAVLDFAAAVCKARQPLCGECLINSKCVFYKVTKKKQGSD